MTRTPKPTSPSRATRSAAAHPGSRRRGFGGTLLGLFIGIVIGVALAAAAAFYVLRAGNPYQPSVAPAAREPAREQGKSARPGEAAGPRFDFYKILPGSEEPKVQVKPERPAPDKGAAVSPPDKAVPATAERAAPTEKASDKAADAAARAARPGERIWLQVGSFAAQGDAENLKAQLALSGLEATVQTATIPDKGVRYRVRLGPYDNADDAGRLKKDLAKRGFEATVIK